MTQKHNKTRNKLKGTKDQDFGTKERNETQTAQKMTQIHTKLNINMTMNES